MGPWRFHESNFMHEPPANNIALKVESIVFRKLFQKVSLRFMWV